MKPTSQPRIFFLITATIVGWWLCVLPRIGRLPGVRQRIEDFRAAGINPTAVFYTDHPGMPDIERTMEAHVQADSGWFWKWSVH